MTPPLTLFCRTEKDNLLKDIKISAGLFHDDVPRPAGTLGRNLSPGIADYRARRVALWFRPGDDDGMLD
jgi:hypothetical protein